MAEYIDRTLLLSDIDAAMNNDGMGYVIGQTLKRYVKRQPSADVAPVVHGRWIASGQCNHKPYRMRSHDHWTTYKCSECGHSNGRRFNDNYCPNCGAKMDLEVPDGQA